MIQVELDKKAPMNLFWVHFLLFCLLTNAHDFLSCNQRDPVTDNWRLTCTKNAEITVKSPEGSPEISYAYDKKRNDHGDEIQLTPLQSWSNLFFLHRFSPVNAYFLTYFTLVALIAQAIIQNNGAIHFDVLQEYVAEVNIFLNS